MLLCFLFIASVLLHASSDFESSVFHARVFLPIAFRAHLHRLSKLSLVTERAMNLLMIDILHFFVILSES